MRIVPTLAVLGGTVAVTVYEPTALEPLFDRLVETEVAGWAIPETRITAIPGPSVWFFTELGSGLVSIGPQGDLARKGFLRLTMSEDNLIALKMLKPDSSVSGITEWQVADNLHVWSVDAELAIEGPSPLIAPREVYVDPEAQGIRFPFLSRDYFREAWSATTVKFDDDRLAVSCEELRKREGIITTIRVGGVPLVLRAPQRSNSDESPWCETNIQSRGDRLILGRSIQEDYDLILDGINRRVVVLSKSSVTLRRPLVRYRRDMGYTGPTFSSWKWVATTGPVTSEDFVLTKLEPSTREFELLCFTKTCSDSVIPKPYLKWVGAPQIIIEDASVTVSEKLGWEGFKMVVRGAAQGIEFMFSRGGFRMVRDATEGIDGERMVFIPVVGEHIAGEFTVPNWPPIADQGIRFIGNPFDFSSPTLPSYRRWHGIPIFKVFADHRIVVTAEITETSCERELLITGTLGGSLLYDFGIELCRYRQMETSDELGYVFDPVSRSEVRSDDFLIEVNRGEVSLGGPDEPCLYISYESVPRLWNPEGRWLAAPVLVLDPITRRISITPTGARGWEYTHEWGNHHSSGRYLDFTPLPIRLQVPHGLSLTDSLWEFMPADAGFAGPTVKISKSRWLSKTSWNLMLLAFEDDSTDSLFSGEETAVYRGIPLITLEESGRLTIRSNGDNRLEFNVRVLRDPSKQVQVEFQPTEYTESGSWPVVVSEQGTECSICLEEFEKEGTVAETLCKHRFHLECLRKVENRLCPYCRTSLAVV